MKSIEERAKEVGVISQYRFDYRYDKRSVEYGYMTGAYDQKDINESIRNMGCYNEEKCKDKFCMKCDEFWKNANSVQRGLAITTIITLACIAGFLMAIILTGVCLILTQ